MNKTFLRTTIFAVASLSLATVALAQTQDGAVGGTAMGGAGMGGQNGMATRGGMEGQGDLGRQGGMSPSSMGHGAMHRRSMKTRRSSSMKHGMSSRGAR